MAVQKQQVQARERARQAKARLDAERAEQDRNIEKAATEFFQGHEEHQRAVKAAADAEVVMVTAVGKLVDLGLSNAQIATVCELEDSQVRTAKKRARELAADSDPTPPPADPT